MTYHVHGCAFEYLLNYCDNSKAVLAHQVNCQGRMGSGFALQVRNRFPEVYKYYNATCARHCIDPEQLMGNAQLCLLNNHPDRFVCNLFGQLNIGTEKRQTNYAQLAASLLLMKSLLKDERMEDATIIFPYKIGCDRGGGDWNIVRHIIGDVFPLAHFLQKGI